MEIINKRIDGGKAFDWGRTSADYAKYRDIYPEEFYQRIVNRGLCTEGQNVLDLGTGTGVLPRNMFRFGAKWTGIDISEEQIEQAKQMARAENMQIDFQAAAAEEIRFADESFDIVTARAVAELRILLELGTPLLKIGGTFIAMKGSQGEDELQKATHACRVLGLGEAKILHSELPNSDGKRINLYLPKIKKTEKRYPRNYADIKKKPL